MARGFLLVLTVLYSVIGCSSNEHAVTRIPGTENAASKSTLIGYFDITAISVSPSERFLFFWEWGNKPFPGERDADMPYTQAACIDLTTGELTPFALDATGHTWESNIVGIDFVPQCWHDEACYIRVKGRTLVFDPRSPRVAYADLPGELTCIDCAPRALLKGAIKRRLGSSWKPGEDTYRFSIPWKDGRFGDRLYYVDGPSVYAQEGDETITLLAKRSRFYRLRIVRLRASPDDALIAFTLFKKIKAPIPTPSFINEVHILDHGTGDTRLAGSYRYVGNYIWSSDSERLYFAANGQDPDDMGVYVVDVPKLFGYDED